MDKGGAGQRGGSQEGTARLLGGSGGGCFGGGGRGGGARGAMKTAYAADGRTVTPGCVRGEVRAGM